MLTPHIEQYIREELCDIGGFDRSEFVMADLGRFEMRAYPGPDCGNNVGTVHGGFLLALCDIAGTAAIDTFGKETSTMSLSTNFLRPCFVDDEYLQVKGEVLRRGMHSAVADVEIIRPTGDLAVKATCTVAILSSDITEGKLINPLPPRLGASAGTSIDS